MTADKTRKRKLTYFIGIDVSRNKLDFAVRNRDHILFHRAIVNDNAAILEFVTEIKKLEKFRMIKAVFCMEDSGYYVNHVLNVLRKLKTNIHLGNPAHIKNSLGLIRDKSDRLDAIRIANYAFRYHDELQFWEPRRKIVSHLAALSTVRARMMNILGMIKVPLKDQRGYIDRTLHNQVVGCCENSLSSIVNDLNLLERSILNIVHSDPVLSRYFKIICSVPYVGPVTAVQIIISTNEFIDINNPRKFACYAGIAPFKQESGVMTGKAQGRISKIGNRKIKRLIHICAVGAIRRQGEFYDYYQRRCAEGKQPLTIINAIRNKIIRRIFSCIKHDRLYSSAAAFQAFLQDDPGNPPHLTEARVPLRNQTKFASRTPGKPLC
ncbi:MAG: transposase [Mucilaginibacter sp.]|jgi:transposase|uniref:IS110 family transposase n=1 Tax=Mucilaginibacter sp. TaxID=1882438 RepID=UPI00356795E2